MFHQQCKNRLLSILAEVCTRGALLLEYNIILVNKNFIFEVYNLLL